MFANRVNDAVERVFGLRVARAGRVDALKSKVRERDAEIKRLRAASAPKPAPKPQPKPKKPALPSDYGHEFAKIWDAVRERTMTGHEKVFDLYQAVQYVTQHDIPGGIVECGVWRGGSMLTVAHTLELLGVRDRELYLFDTYEGMTEPTERDVQISNQKTAGERLATAEKSAWVWAIASLADVQEGFKQVNYPADRLHFVEGDVEKTVPGGAPDPIAILRLDTDWYASTKHELHTLYHRLSPGGVLIIDDYGTWQGSKDATDEFLAETGEPLLLLKAGQGRVAVKPGLTTRVPGPKE